MKKYNVTKLALLILIVGAFIITIGYASFNKTFNISDSTVHVRTDKKIRITNLLVDHAQNEAVSLAEDYDYNMLSLDISMPNKDSYITYSTTVSNIGNIEMLITQIYLNDTYKDIFDIEVSNYSMGDVLRDDNDSCSFSANGCKLGISRNIKITLKYKEGVYDLLSNHEFNNIIIYFEFTSNVELKFGENIFDLGKLVNNTYINGESLVDYNGWSTSEYIDVSNYKKIIIVSDNSRFLKNYNAVYDENMNFVRNVNLDKSKIENDLLGGVTASLRILELNNNEKYLRISADDETLKHLKIYPLETEDFYNRFLFSINKDTIKKYQFGDNNILTDDLIIKKTYISSSDGSLISYDTWDSTDFLYVGDYKYIAIYSDNDFSLTSYNAMYDSDKNFVKSFGASAKSYSSKIGYYFLREIPSNVKYIRMSANSSELGKYKITFAKEEVYDSDNSQSQNLILGESLFNTTEITYDAYISNTTGQLVTFNNWASTDYIQVDDYYGIITLNFSENYDGYYSSEKKYIGSFNCGDFSLYNEILGDVGVDMCYFPRDDDYSYLRFSQTTSSLSKLLVYPVLNDNFNRNLLFTIN